MNKRHTTGKDESPKASPQKASADCNEADESLDPLSQTDSILQSFENQLKEIARVEPRIQSQSAAAEQSSEDLRALLEISLGINSTMRLEDTLQSVMKNAIDLLSGERGFIMLLDEYGQLQFKTAYNLRHEDIGSEDFRISSTIANKVARSGKAIFTSDAQDDERFANQASVQELHLRSIICVPMALKNSVIGVIYLDNSRQAKHFLKTDLYILQLLAGLAASAIHNATLYEHLLDLKKFTEKVVNKSPVGMLVMNGEYQIVSINDAALQVFDKNKEEVRFVTDDENPTRFFELISDNSAEKWRQMIDIAFTTKSPFEDARYFHNTGYVEKALSVKISPLEKLPLGSDGIIMTIEDITEKVIMEKYVILSEKLVARGEMAASIAHELNNYLTIINNNAELLTRNLDSQKFEKVGFNCKQIIESISKMKRFTDGLMDTGKLDGDFISYDVKRLLEDLLFSLRAQDRFKEILFTINLSGPLPTIQMDVGQIQQVFLNLMNNAADALEECEKSEREPARKNRAEANFEKRICIAARVDGAKKNIVVELSDNALGMSPDTLSKLFQPHFTTKKDGHGLGLANCKKIAARHGGQLTAESTPGEGSLFRLTLPLNRDDADANS
ncbi:MAG: ATP-binding protein [Candidatus Zixiibacteriota bacterium]